MIRIEILVNCRPHYGSMRTLVVETSPQMKTPSGRLDFGSIKVSIAQPNDQLIILVDTQSYKPISGSIDNLKTSKCMQPI